MFAPDARQLFNYDNRRAPPFAINIMHNLMPAIGRRHENEFYILINLICHNEDALSIP